MTSNKYWEEFWNENEILNSANPQNQIGRSINRMPISEDLWQKTLEHIYYQMDISEQDIILDLCAGNGLISIPLSKKVKKIVAVDISQKLINLLDDNKIINITTINDDIRKLKFKDRSFSKIIFYFAIQHFSERDIISLFEKVYSWLKPGGIFYIGDIPNIEKLFLFFNTKEREKIFFDSITIEKPIIGTWFHKSFLEKLGLYIGFNKIEIITQPNNFINSHYRFDMKLLRPI